MVRPWFSTCVLLLAGFAAIDPQRVQAQGPGLGGYGTSSSMAPESMGGTGPIIPYGGSLSGFMPYRMSGGGSGLSFYVPDLCHRSGRGERPFASPQ